MTEPLARFWRDRDARSPGVCEVIKIERDHVILKRRSGVNSRVQIDRLKRHFTPVPESEVQP